LTQVQVQALSSEMTSRQKQPRKPTNVGNILRHVYCSGLGLFTFLH